jgi:hypothetical protein
MTDSDIELEAIRIHNESEALEARIWKELKRHKHNGPYPALAWKDIKEGFYKERTRLLAKQKLETKDALISRRRPCKVPKVRNVPKRKSK